MNFTDKRFSFALGEYHDKKVIWTRFQKDRELINFLKNNTTKPRFNNQILGEFDSCVRLYAGWKPAFRTTACGHAELKQFSICTLR
jgi:hypothetical protein